MKKILFIVCFLISVANCLAQKQFSFGSSNSMFPDNAANSKYSSSDGKYNDNSCIVYVPKHFNKNKPWHYFLWFHGCNNNIYSTIEQFKLREQLTLSGANYILIMPEAAKNCMETYSGKWEQPKYFNQFMEDAKLKLISEKIVDKSSSNNQLIIAGHSGASRVLVKIMDNSSTAIKAILLFDAISGFESNIVSCLQKQPSCKLINLYTSKENTNRSSKKLLQLLQKANLNVLQKNDTDLKDEDIRANRIISLYTNLSHNDVAVSYNYLSRFLKAVE